ncbi:peptidylprolyl isomerase [Altererythrobacter sp. GH1-8]|uniref:peptidylprolyl isomerase n=1 Tax=Altererythrobacter sp. GH1-8 TaxID=3349333 RepID=UPI00374DD75C
MNTFSTRLSSLGLSAFATIGVVFAPVAASAQQAAADNPLGLPDEVNMLGNDDPNMRKATAIVNGQVITGTDVDQRVALVLSASQNQISPAELQQLRERVLRNLIDETLQIQEAEAQEIPVSQDQINQTYARVAAQNFGQETQKMDEYLLRIGSSPASLKRQIHGELAWQNILGRNIAPFINVSEEEVNETMKRLEESRGTDEYRLGEIYMSATTENQQSKLQTMQQILEQLQQGGSFQAYARQFSEASTAPVGGDLGFVRLGQLPVELAQVAQEMQPGQLVGPIPIPGGFSILYLIDKRQVLMADPRDAIVSLKQISINFPAGISEEQVGSRIEAFTQGVQAIRGCGDADDAAAALGADIVTNDQLAVRQLPDQLQTLVLRLQIGQVTPPFGSIEDGVRVLMLCGRDDPQGDTGPSFEELMAQKEDERINKRAQRYLRDLRNDAYIEYN